MIWILVVSLGVIISAVSSCYWIRKGIMDDFESDRIDWEKPYTVNMYVEVK